MSHIDSQRKRERERERQKEIKHNKHVGTTRPNLIWKWSPRCSFWTVWCGACQAIRVRLLRHICTNQARNDLLVSAECQQTSPSQSIFANSITFHQMFRLFRFGCLYKKYLTKINDRSIWDFHVAVCRKIADISPKSRCSSGSSGRMFSSACICTKNQWPSAAKPFCRGHFSWVKPEQSWLTNESNMPTPFVEKHTNTHSHVCYVCFFGKHSTKKLKKL